MRTAYPTDLSDAEWSYLEPYLPSIKTTGRPRLHHTREILDALFYVLKSGCPWRLLPHDFPPWKTVHHYFRTWRIDGTWEKLHTAIRERLRVRMKRNTQPSAGIVQPVGEDNWCRRGARVRWRKEGEGKKAPFVGGYAGFGAKSEGSAGQRHGS